MSRSLYGCDGLTVVVGLEGGRRGEAGPVDDAAVEAAMVEPVDVAQGGELDVVQAAPGPVSVDELPLVEPVEALGEGVVVAVALGADRGDDVVLVEPVGVADAEVPLGTPRSE